MSERRHGKDESGAIAVLTAVMALVLFGVGAFAVDLAYDYSQRRQMQNASDSGALAGAKALSDNLYGVSSPDLTTIATTVDAKAKAAVVANNGELANYSCTLTFTVANVGTPLACSNPAGYVSSTLGLPVGVTVTSGQSTSPFFGGIFGANKLTAFTTATARVAALKSGNGPFAICGVGANQVSPVDQTGPDGTKYTANVTKLPDIISGSAGSYSLNPKAVTLIYRVHGPQVDDCGEKSNSFKGLVDENNGPFPIPGVIDTDTGTKAGPVRTAVSNSCDVDSDPIAGCTVVIPVCDKTPEPKQKLYCDFLATFKVTQTGANTHDAQLLPDAIISYGSVGTGSISYGQARTVQLIA